MTRRRRFWFCARRGSWRKGSCERVPPGQTVKFLVKLFSKSLQGIKGGGAPFCSALRAAQCATRSKKRPCQPKTAKRFFGGPGSQGPPGQAKERTRILPVRRGFSAFGVPRRLPGRPLFAKPAAVWTVGFCARCPGVCSLLQPAGCACALPQVGPRSASLFPARVPCCLLLFVPGLRVLSFSAFVKAFTPAACLLVLCVVCALFFSQFLPFSA